MSHNNIKNNKIKRRDFFKIAATSGAAVAVASCNNDPVEKILPSLLPPDNYQTGVALHFASVCQECPSQCGIVVKTREGRAIKIEGNPNHPLNQGKLCAIGQSALQGLYSPNRIKKATQKGKQLDLATAKNEFYGKIKRLVAENRGKEILFISPAGDSSLQRMTTKIISRLGASQIQLDLSSANSIKNANKILYGKNEVPDYQFSKANFLLNFGADFLEGWLNVMKNSREFAEFHSYKRKNKNEYVHISPHLSTTGVQADDWINCPSKAEEAIALALVARLAASNSSLSAAEKRIIRSYTKNHNIAAVAKKYQLDAKKLEQIAKKLATKSSLIIGGGNATSNGEQTKLQIAIALLNYLTGNTNLNFGADYKFGGSSFAEIKKAVQKIKNKKYSLVVILELNPAYIFSIFSEWSDKKEIQGKVPIVSLSLSHSETTEQADLVIPITSSFENWGDSFAANGIYALQQPVMAKLPGFEAEPLGDILLGLTKELGWSGDNFEAADFKNYLRSQWRGLQTQLKYVGTFEMFWIAALKKGGIFQNYTPQRASLKTNALAQLNASETKTAKGISLMVLNSNLHSNDGRTGDRYWLLEIPHPLTQVVWDSWLEINPDKAQELGIQHLDEVEVTTSAGSVKLAAYIYDFIDKNTVAIPAGMGRSLKFPNYSSRRNSILPFKGGHKRTNLVEKKVGLNPFELIPFATDDSGELIFSAENISLKKTGKKSFLVSSDGQYKDDSKALIADTPTGYGDRSQKGRHLIRSVSLKELNSGKIHKEGHQLKDRFYTTDRQNTHDFYKEKRDGLDNHIFGIKGSKTGKYYDPYKFEMSIDLDKCTGCSACVVACYAENNIAVVGKERQAIGREMSWLRIERYLDKDKKTGKIQALLSPQMCQQCGNAGCEAVCPVYATYHNPDGLNAQIYNRCVGTRYCANNCVYKQRRFNWRSYSFPSPLHYQLNPDVTVRDKGVMEKCTFCVQRIVAAKDKAKDDNRIVFDGEIKTACQQTCPTEAIVFGNAMDKKSLLTKTKKDIRGYHQLEELNFQPGVTYLSKIKRG